MVVAFDGNGCEAALDGARRICPVCRGGEEDDVAVSLSDIFQISADDAQTGVFAGGTGVRLERATREAGDFAQVRRQILNQLRITFHLVFRGIRMDILELGEAEREHRRGRIELHRA